MPVETGWFACLVGAQKRENAGNSPIEKKKEYVRQSKVLKTVEIMGNLLMAR